MGLMKMIWMIATNCAVLAFSLSIASQMNPAATGTDSLKEDLVRLERQSWEAWKNHDGKFFDSFLSDNHVEPGASGVSTKKQVVDFVRGGVCEVKSYDLKNFELHHIAGNVALLTYYETQETTCGDKPVPSPCWVSSLYVKKDGRWLNVLFQQTKAAK